MSEYLLNHLIETGQPYIYTSPRDEWDDIYHVYDTESKLQRLGRMHLDKDQANKIFAAAMTNITDKESLEYQAAQTNPSKQEALLIIAKNYIARFPELMQWENDVNVMLKRLRNALFEGYVLQPLIDDPDISDIKVVAPDDIRVRIRGKAYLSNASFLNNRDLCNFIHSIGLRNNREIFTRPFTRFVDKFDENYRLRFSITMPRILQGNCPVMHIRKVPKKKPGIEELMRRGMLTPIVVEYLKDKAKTGRGVGFFGPPGSGKSTLLNEWIEFIPKCDECLCIQENDELFTEQKGWIFKTPDLSYDEEGNPFGVTMDALGQMALVEGCNRFIVGEAKGGEMRSVASLLNTGCSVALTAHSNSARESLPRLADMVTTGSTFSMETAKNMISGFDVIVYMEKYKVREILENTGYNRQTDEFEYRTIYKFEE